MYQHQGPERMFWVAFAVMLVGWIVGATAELLVEWCSPAMSKCPPNSEKLGVACEEKTASDSRHP